ncbi:MAG: hypothetical protein ABJB97_06710, partial [Acidobacteriota bacterium]
LVAVSAEPGRGLAQNIGWVTRPTARDLTQFLTMLNLPFFSRQSSVSSFNEILTGGLVFVFLGLPLLALLWRTFKASPKRSGERLALGWLLLFTFLPIVLVFVLSWILPHSIWGSRHLIITVAPYSMLIALALTRLRPAWLKAACLMGVGIWFLLTGTVLILKPPTVFSWCAWDNLALQALKSDAYDTQVVQVYAFEDLVAYHLWFSLDTVRSAGNGREFKVTVIKGVSGLIEDPAYFLPRRFNDVEVRTNAEFAGDEVWVAFRDREWNEKRPPLSIIDRKIYRVGKVLEFQAEGEKAFLVQLLK